MLKVGVTGGIGSGKSVVCRVFGVLGIPVFNADDAARYLMNHDQLLKSKIVSLLGAGVYEGGVIVRQRISDAIYRSPDLLAALNALVHPATITYAATWMEQQTTPYIIKEAAIFFESGSHKAMDKMVGVFAPADLRIARAVARGGVTAERVSEIMARQMDETEKMNRCDYVINNNDCQAVLPQVLKIHRELLDLSGVA